MNSVAGLEVRIDGVPVTSAAEFSAMLNTGIHSVTITIGQAKRTDPLLLELIDTSNGGNAELVTR